MIYRAIGIMSGSSLDGLDIAFTELTETGGKWSYQILVADCLAYETEWKEKLANATSLSAADYLLLHTAYGHYIGQAINKFIDNNNLHHRVNLVASHGHTTFHLPGQKMTAQIGDGAAIAAETCLPVVSDLRSMDVALGGQGAPIVPIGEKLLLAEYDYFLNIGGIANISINADGKHVAFDICAANRVLNMLAAKKGLLYDDAGKIAASGKLNEQLLEQLNQLDYYRQPAPKSLANSFGTDTVYQLIEDASLTVEDALRTYTQHIAAQVKAAIGDEAGRRDKKLLLTGGGAFNTFLKDRISDLLKEKSIAVVVPDEQLVKYKEALIMALIGVLRWREEINVLASVTGASQNSIGGALWMSKA
ncbi:anhydro-N-acetylmuramic acid kinase [Ferruginibacter paludis]|uniref:anhydro-N-acetylmuramic acid kinase n=1 Tax=Ferruginibacter paludis TaxID=1310417 RepID=UPI0025B62100|nr:anhydro-N-acetylmuramic acid kinase [Ferruginibacter paludis]MDN3658797.1 anhydro-N-acetylmuramic acid kinase [Ferruginibacter paludis]